MQLFSRLFPSFAWCLVRFAVFLFATFFSPTSYSADVTTDGFKLFVDGKKMVIKGMNYSPVPIGAKPENPPYGDYFVLNYRNVWKPDLAMMRAAASMPSSFTRAIHISTPARPGRAATGKPF